MGKDEDIRVFLLEAAPTEWDESERVAGSADLPLTSAGEEQIGAIASELRDASVALILCGTDEASRTAARLLAEATRAKVRPLERLDEADLGLWEGLRRKELVEKFPAAFKKWLEDPCSVTAPEGEALRDAADRIVTALARALEKHRANGRQSVAVVLRPVAYSLVRCWLEGRDASDLWSLIAYTPEHRWASVSRGMVRAARDGLKAAI